MTAGARGADVLVIGAGIVGAAVALRAAAAGRTVTLLSPSDGSSATSAAGAMLGAIGETTAEPASRKERLLVELRLRSAARWPEWHAEISDACLAPPLRQGTFVTAGRSRPRDLAAMDAMDAVARAAGLPIEHVSPSDVPGLRPTAGHEPARASFLADERWIDAPGMLAAVLAAAAATGRVRRIDGAALALLESNGTVRGVSTDGYGDVLADDVVVCAGARTAELLAATPDVADGVPRVLPAKGVALHLAPPPRLFEPSPFEAAIRTPNREFACGLHVLPHGDGVYLGASNRVTRWPGITGDVTASEVVRLIANASRELFDDLTRWNATGAMYGERPLPADGLPIVGRASVDGLVVATGTYRNGVLLAPLLADLVAEHLDGGPGLPDLSPGPSRLVDVDTPEALLRDGLRDFAELLRDPEGPPPQPELGLLLTTLGRLMLERSDDADTLRAQIRDLLTELPVVELVPEAIIELCHPEFLP